MLIQLRGIALISILALSACSGDPAEPEQVQPVQITSADQLDIPLKDYQPSSQDMELLGQATEELMQRCMAKFGAGGAATPFGDAAAVGDINDIIYGSRYGLIDLEQAKTTAYMPKEFTEAVQDFSTPTGVELEVMVGMTEDGTPSTLTAPDGSPLPEGGCLGAAVEELDPTAMSAQDALSQIDSQALERTAADARAIAAQDAWSQCMKQAGYDVAKRADAELAAMQMQSDEEQVRQAVADVECAISTNYVGIWNAVDAAFQRQLIAERESDLQESARALREAVARASEIVSGKQ